MSAPLETELDRQALAALANVKLHHFTAEPSTIGPFASSEISWEVVVPEEYDVTVDINLDGMSVPPTGELSVSPEFTKSYHLRARAGRYSKVLGTVTVHVDLARCVILNDEPGAWIAAGIEQEIDTDTSVYFRFGGPIVTIKDDRMVITLMLAERVHLFPDAAVDIQATFGLDVVLDLGPHGLGAITPFGHHRLAPANVEINVDVRFPWWAWALPGAIIGLGIAVDNGKDKARRRATKMVGDIVDQLNTWFKVPQIHNLDRHDAGFYVNPERDELFWVTFCPPLRPVVEPGRG